MTKREATLAHQATFFRALYDHSMTLQWSVWRSASTTLAAGDARHAPIALNVMEDRVFNRILF
jgi:hypothetical protein